MFAQKQGAGQGRGDEQGTGNREQETEAIVDGGGK